MYKQYITIECRIAPLLAGSLLQGHRSNISYIVLLFCAYNQLKNMQLKRFPTKRKKKMKQKATLREKYELYFYNIFCFCLCQPSTSQIKISYQISLEQSCIQSISICVINNIDCMHTVAPKIFLTLTLFSEVQFYSLIKSNLF